MTNSLRRTAVAVLALAALVVTPAEALAPVTVTTKDPSPSVVTRPTLVSPRQVIKLRENARAPFTPVRFKVYPETYGYRPSSSACQAQFRTPYRKTGSNGKVLIVLGQRKPLCAGVLYQAQALIGKGDVPDKFAHLCVRGRTPDSTACQDSL